MRLFVPIVLGLILGAILCFIVVSLYSIEKKITYLYEMVQDTKYLSDNK